SMPSVYTSRGAHSHLAVRTEERRARSELLTHDERTAATAGETLPVVDLMQQLVLARPPVQVDVLLIAECRATMLHRFVQHLDDGAVEPADLHRRQRLRRAVVTQAGFPEDLVAVDVAEAGDERLVHQQRLELRRPRQEHLAE